MYCGDETGAFVGDISSYSSCFGYAGDDCPKSVLTSYMYKDGMIPNSLHRLPPAKKTTATNDNNKNGPTEDSQNLNRKLASFQENHEDLIPIYSPYPKGSHALNPDCYLENDGLIQNYDAYENVWMKAFHDLNVRHLGKHFNGFGEGSKYTNNSNGGLMNKRVKIRRLYGKMSSTNLNHAKVETYDDSLDVDDQVLIHPLLAVDSGHTDFNMSESDSSSSEASISLKNKQRCKIMEILFESLSAPAAFIAPSPMVSSFAFGRQTSLIVDIGARGMRVTPIVDGLLLENAQRRSGRGGEWLNSVQHHVLNEHYLKEKMKHQKKEDGSLDHCYVHPRYVCQHNKDGKVKVNYPYRDIQQSIFHDVAMRDVMYEMKTSPHVSGVALYRDDDWTIPFLHLKSSTKQSTSSQLDTDQKDGTTKENEGEESNQMDVDKKEEDNEETQVDEDAEDDPNEEYETKCKKVYSLPDGTRINVEKTETGKDLCRVAELFFADKLPFSNAFQSSTSTSPADLSLLQPKTFSSLPIHELIKSSLSAVADADVRKELCGNIILTGASSLFPNLEQRLSLEISHLVPNMYRCKVICSRNTLERRFSPWIGSSVLTSLGSFQQLWLGKAEYEEYGGILATQRFP